MSHLLKKICVCAKNIFHEKVPSDKNYIIIIFN